MVQINQWEGSVSGYWKEYIARVLYGNLREILMVSKSFPGPASYPVIWTINWGCLYSSREDSGRKKHCYKISETPSFKEVYTRVLFYWVEIGWLSPTFRKGLLIQVSSLVSRKNFLLILDIWSLNHLELEIKWPFFKGTLVPL